jgi:aminoglycoside phosphotransferase (APT) family kinase protein
VRERVEAEIGARVVATESGRGGYSPSFASRCDLDDGRALFVKAVSPAQNPDSPGMLRSEIAVTAALPRHVPAPRLIAAVDDGEWVVGVFEHVDGRTPGDPWTDDDLHRVTRALDALATTPLPPALAAVLPRAEDRLADQFGDWRRLADTGCDDPIDGWAAEHLEELVALETGWEDALHGDALLHFDARSDNILVERTGRVVLVDWPHACTGAPWVDLVVTAPAIALEGGPDPAWLLELAGIVVDHDVLDTVVAALAGYFVRRGGLPDPPGLPTVRAFQRAQGAVTLEWLSSRLGPARANPSRRTD